MCCSFAFYESAEVPKLGEQGLFHGYAYGRISEPFLIAANKDKDKFVIIPYRKDTELDQLESGVYIYCDQSNGTILAKTAIEPKCDDLMTSKGGFRAYINGMHNNC